MSGKIVLITRPLHDAVPVAEAVEQKGWRPFIEPMMNIMPLEPSLPDLSAYQGLVFTSANGVRCFCALSDQRDLPIYTVGRDTARVAIEEGFEKLTCGQGDLDTLMALLDINLLQKDGRPLLHLAGEHIARPFDAPGILTERLALYRAEAAPVLTDRLLNMLAAGDVAAVMFFSPRTARIFKDLLLAQGRAEMLSTTKVLCISDRVLKCIKDLPWKAQLVAAQPGRRAMMALL